MNIKIVPDVTLDLGVKAVGSPKVDITFDEQTAPSIK